jgi:hypothetical protein
MRTRVREVLILLSLLPVPCILVAQQPAAVQIAGKDLQSVQITEGDLKKMAKGAPPVQGE